MSSSHLMPIRRPHNQPIINPHLTPSNEQKTKKNPLRTKKKKVIAIAFLLVLSYVLVKTFS